VGVNPPQGNDNCTESVFYAMGLSTDNAAGPYFVSNAIRESSYYTSDIEEADAIIVDDYCYKVGMQETWFSKAL
jgi:hypothetical protein